MVQLQTMRLQAANSLNLSARMNSILTNDEVECGAVSADDLGKTIRIITLYRRRRRRWVSINSIFIIFFAATNRGLVAESFLIIHL